MKMNLQKIFWLVGIILVFSFSEAQSGVSVNVFELSKRGTPAQLKEAVKSGAVFSVTRDYDSEDEENFDEERIFSWSETPLHLAAAYNPNPESVKFLVSLGLDVNQSGEEGNGISGTPLSCALWHDNYAAAKALLESGADPNQWSMIWFYCGTPFHDAAQITNSKDIRLLVDALMKAGGDINIHVEAYEEDRLKISDTLKKNSTDSITLKEGKIDTEDPFNLENLPLSRADTLNFEGTFTPLMYAVLYDNPDAVNIFLDCGADAKIRSVEGKTAYDYAKFLPENSRLKKSPAYLRLRKSAKN